MSELLGGLSAVAAILFIFAWRYVLPVVGLAYLFGWLK